MRVNALIPWSITVRWVANTRRQLKNAMTMRLAAVIEERTRTKTVVQWHSSTLDTRYECLNTHLSARLHVYSHLYSTFSFYFTKKTWSMNECGSLSCKNGGIFAPLNERMNEYIVRRAIHRFGMNVSPHWCSEAIESARGPSNLNWVYTWTIVKFYA